MASNPRITDFRIQVSFPHNRKTKKLYTLLGAEGIWALVKLWAYAAQNEPDGCFLGWSEDDFAISSDYPGNAKELYDGLVESGFLLVTSDGCELNDWEENQPWIAGAQDRSEQARKAVEARWARRKGSSSSIPAEFGQNTGSMPTEYGPNTGCNTPLPSLPSPSLPKNSSDSSFDEFWAQYPRKDAKKKAESAWKRIPKTEHEAIFSALKRHISTVWKNALERKEKQFIPLPTSWLNGERWKDEAEATPALQNGRKSGDTWTPPQPPSVDLSDDSEFLFYQKLKAERAQE